MERRGTRTVQRCQNSAPAGLALCSSSKDLCGRMFIARPFFKSEGAERSIFARRPSRWSRTEGKCPAAPIVRRLRMVATKLAR